MPTAGRHGASPGLSLRASSIFTYSAVARVSSSASTRPPKGRTLVCNADPGRPLLLGHGFRSAGIPWNYSSRRLTVVLGLNVALILALAIVGVTAHSVAVLSEGVDYLADA